MEAVVDLIETRSVSEQVYQYLCTQIIEGVLNYGEVLNTKHMASKLGVSTMPVREAIKRLEMEGIIIIKPRSTCTIRMPTKKSILDALEMREFIELHCMEKISGTLPIADLDTLKTITARMGDLLSSQDTAGKLRDYIRLDREFHTEICRLAENEFLTKFYRETSLHLNMSFIYNIAIPPDMALTFQDHQNLVSYLESHSPKAVELLRTHLIRSRNNITSGAVFASLS